ncbi:MAG: NAD(P)H:quinone oxidoreductase [Pseudohongiellaceae bacterium]|jgi:NAD(P)H dehydrogenase (quinone)
MSKPYILVLFYSRYGATAQMANLIGRGIETSGEFEARLRTVPAVSATTKATEPAVPDSGAAYCEEDDLRHCSALALGSPARFGNMAAALKHFLEGTGGLWTSGALIDKPVSTFTSSGSLHGGQESTLLTMAIPMLHHGMIYCGIPYSETELNTTGSGGTPYGATHVAGSDGKKPITDEERALCLAQGKRLASLAARLR